MTITERDGHAGQNPAVPATLPRARTALVLAAASVLVLAVTAWLAVRPNARSAQTAMAKWFNNPPQPLDAVLAASNPLLRPVPLTVVSVALLGWVLLTCGGRLARLEVVRAGVVAVTVAEVIAQVLKRLLNQPRPAAVIPGMDVHGYPKDPWGHAYPSAHTAVVVGVVAALWPWMRWPQRVVAVVLAALIPLNRLYIAAHWPIDVVGGIAIGLLAGALAWLIAARWPLGAPG